MNKPEALRLADLLTADAYWSPMLGDQAAAELRRLHWEELRVREHRDQMCAEVTRLHALSAELLEALQDLYAEQNAAPLWKRQEHWQASMDKANAAIEKATGENNG